MRRFRRFGLCVLDETQICGGCLVRLVSGHLTNRSAVRVYRCDRIAVQVPCYGIYR